MIDPNKKYRTRDGKHRVLEIHVAQDPSAIGYPIIAIVEGPRCDKGWLTFNMSGKYLGDHDNWFDLIEVGPYDDYKIDEPVFAHLWGHDGWWPKHFAGVCGKTDAHHTLPLPGAKYGMKCGGRSPMREHGFIKPDTDKQVFFYEQDFYVLSNFSAFRVNWMGQWYDTAEAAYQASKFPNNPMLQYMIRTALSAHEAFKIAQESQILISIEWYEHRVRSMQGIIRAKTQQHDYVYRKLMDTGTRELIEDSWRDDFWGWGPNRDGQNMLGKLWMELREELRTSAAN
jgi:ribA/ribD-fused uncharacterized protein